MGSTTHGHSSSASSGEELHISFHLRLGIQWSLADKWKAMALQALECGDEGCMMPTWSFPTPLTPPAAGGASGGADRGRTTFREVASAFGGSGRLLGTWAVGKTRGAVGGTLGRVVPPPVKRLALRVAARAAERG